jgi:hypothetical protein
MTSITSSTGAVPGRALAEQSSIAKISAESHQEVEAKNRRCDADYRCSAIHCFVNLLAFLVVAVFMIVGDPIPYSRLSVKRLAVLVLNHLGSPSTNL